MPRFLLIPILFAPLLPATLPASAGTQGPHWQEGEILSRKTINPGRHNTQTRYVYRIKSGGKQYTVRFDRPLSVGLMEPLKFTVSRKHLVVQDADGSQLKASILKKSEPAMRQ
jgi:hypothetical protein